jgi:hypothetical protein
VDGVGFWRVKVGAIGTLHLFFSPWSIVQGLVEKIDGSLPGQGRCGLVITRGGIVMEAVIHPFIDVGRVPDPWGER